MTWQLFDAEILGNQAQILLDDQFITDNPGDLSCYHSLYSDEKN